LRFLNSQMDIVDIRKAKDDIALPEITWHIDSAPRMTFQRQFTVFQKNDEPKFYPVCHTHH